MNQNKLCEIDNLLREKPVKHIKSLYALLKSTDCDVGTVESLLKKITDINVQTKKGYTFLHVAVQNTNLSIDVLKLLLKQGIKPNITNIKGETPLHFCCNSNFCNLNVVKELLYYGASISVETSIGSTPLALAISNYSCNQTVIKELLERDKLHITINKSLASGTSPLQAALYCNREIGVIRELLQHDADVNSKDPTLRSPLHEAAFNPLCSSNIITLLLKYGADIEARNEKLCTPLHFAFNCDPMNHDVVRVLLKHGADICARDYRGFSTLHYGLCNPTLGIEFLKELLVMDINIIDCIMQSADLENILSLCFSQKQHSYAFTLLKFMALKSFLAIEKGMFSDTIKYFFENETYKVEANKSLKLLHDCMYEIKKMASDKVIKHIYFYDLMKRDFSNVANNRSIETKNIILREVISRINSDSYPNYKDFILYISKANFVQYLESLQVYSWKKTIVLDPCSVNYITQFLSKDDVINLIIAYTNPVEKIKTKESKILNSAKNDSEKNQTVTSKESNKNKTLNLEEIKSKENKSQDLEENKTEENKGLHLEETKTEENKDLHLEETKTEENKGLNLEETKTESKIARGQNLNKNSSVYDVNFISGRKVYMCTFCQYQTRNKGHVEKHVRVHTKERPFICWMCSKGFYAKENLTTHLKSHACKTPVLIS